MTSDTGCCDSVGMLGCVHCFFALVFPLFLRLFMFVEGPIFLGCSVFFWRFWRWWRRVSCWFVWCCYCYFFVVIAFVVTSVVDVSTVFIFVVVAFPVAFVVLLFSFLFWLPESTYLLVLGDPPRFRDRINGWDDCLFLVDVDVVDIAIGVVIVIDKWLLWTGSSRITQFFAGPAEGPPALHDHQHLVLIGFIRGIAWKPFLLR